MKIKEKYKIKSIDNFVCKDWLLNKHYAKRIPSISYAFGLFNEKNILNGIVCYGRPIAHSLVKNAFNGEYQEQFLVVNEGLEKNTLSFFVAESLKMLPKPQVLVSYADLVLYWLISRISRLYGKGI